MFFLHLLNVQLNCIHYLIFASPCCPRAKNIFPFISWILRSAASSEQKRVLSLIWPILLWFSVRSSSAVLLYEVNVIPRFNFPAIFLERIIRSDLPVNLRALASRAEKIYLENQRCGSRKFSAMDSKPSSTSSQLKFHSTAIETTSSKFKEAPPTAGVSSVLPSPSSELISKWGVYGNACRIDRPCVVDEIHLRRFDGLLVIYYACIITKWILNHQGKIIKCFCFSCELRYGLHEGTWGGSQVCFC